MINIIISGKYHHKLGFCSKPTSNGDPAVPSPNEKCNPEIEAKGFLGNNCNANGLRTVITKPNPKPRKQVPEYIISKASD